MAKLRKLSPAALAPEPLKVLGFAVYTVDALVVRSTRNLILSRLWPHFEASLGTPRQHRYLLNMVCVCSGNLLGIDIVWYYLLEECSESICTHFDDVHGIHLTYKSCF